MSILDSIRSSVSGYFESSKSPTSKLTADIEKARASLSGADGVNNLLKQVGDAAIKKIAVTPSTDNSAKLQKDGTFLTPDDPNGKSSMPKWVWFALGGVALIAFARR